MVRDNIVVNIYGYIVSLLFKLSIRYWPVITWKRLIILFINRRNIGFFPRVWEVPLIKRTVETMEYGKASILAPSLRRRGLIRSGPEALDALRCCRTSLTSWLEIVIDI